MISHIVFIPTFIFSKKMADKCNIGKELGKGSYGTVYQSADDDGTVIKVPNGAKNKSYIPTEFAMVSYPEIDSLFRMRSPFVARGYAVYQRDECGGGMDVSLKIERCTGQISDLTMTNVRTKVSPPKIPYFQFKQLMLTMAYGLRCLHRNGYLHLDLSETNIMYTNVGGKPENCIAKIIDTGMSNYVERTADGRGLLPLLTRRLRCNPSVRAPEIFFPKDTRFYECTDRADVWSLGIVFLCMIRGVTSAALFNYYNEFNTFKHTNEAYAKDASLALASFFSQKITSMFDGTNLNTTVDTIVEKYIQKEAEGDISVLKNLLYSMLRIDPTRRYNIEQVIDHPFFISSPIPLDRDRYGVPYTFKSFIRNTFTDICESDARLPVSSDTVIGDAALSGIRHIFEAYRFEAAHPLRSNRFIQSSTATMCLSFDLYMRFVLSSGPYITDIEAQGMAYLACRIAYCLFQDIGDANPGFLGTFSREAKDLAATYESIFLKSTEGKIFLHNFYDICDTLFEVSLIIHNIFELEDREALQNYTRIDFSQYVRMLRGRYSPAVISKIRPAASVFDLLDRFKSVGLKSFERAPGIPVSAPPKSSGRPEPKAFKYGPQIDGLRLIIERSVKDLGPYSIRIMFLAMEIYSRTLGQLPPHDLIYSRLIAVACLEIAFSAIYGSDITYPGNNEERNDPMFKLQVAAINYLSQEYFDFFTEKVYNGATSDVTLGIFYKDYIAKQADIPSESGEMVYNIANIPYEEYFKGVNKVYESVPKDPMMTIQKFFSG